MTTKQPGMSSDLSGRLTRLLLGVSGGFFGWHLDDFAGGLLGLLLGLLAAEVLSLRTRLGLLAAELLLLRSRLDQVERPAAAGHSQSKSADGAVIFQPEPEEEAPPQGETADKKAESSAESMVDRFFRLLGNAGIFCRETITEFFTSGNLVLKIGILVLFFGVAFLLKYAAQRNMVPVEFRLAGAALGGMVLLGLGWRFRQKRSDYGLVLQGGGIGLLYLVIFATARLYGFLPVMLGLPLMVGLVAFSCLLALLQESRSLAVFAIIGGFLAPVLLSSGEGNHVLLFSYYGLLNAGILAIAWFKAWRELNLIGFVFTFAIGTLWGALAYRPEQFFSTEPFLLLFFVFYFAISLLFARRQPVDLRGYVDGPLVFGLPLVVSGLQYCLVRDFHYGMAFSALGFGLFYLTVATVLWRRSSESMRLLCEVFLALGIVFTSLAIPLALDGHLASSIWALEGAGMIWIGARQKRVLARIFGLLLQLAAAYIFVDAVWYPFYALAFANRYFLGCSFLAFSALFSSYCLRNDAALKKWERYFPIFLLTWGLVWWYIGGLREVDRQMMPRDMLNGVMLFVCASSILFALVARKLPWRRLEASLLIQLPAMVLMVLFSALDFHAGSNLFDRWGIAAWILGFTTQYRILYFYSETWKNSLKAGYHLVTMWLLLFVVCREVVWYVKNLAGVSEVWSMVCWGILPAAALLILLRLSGKPFWPVGRYPALYLGEGGLVPAISLFCWSIDAFTKAGDPLPLPYIPLLNPLEMAGLLVVTILVFWVLNRRNNGYTLIYLPDKQSFMAIALLFFLWMNSVVARTVHFYAGIPYNLQALYRSVVFQAAIAALWGVAALALTVWAARRGSRPLWAVGAILLGMVVVKLFLVDLSGTGTIARIVSFLVVGVLMLIIGYFSPMPPRQEEKT